MASPLDPQAPPVTETPGAEVAEIIPKQFHFTSISDLPPIRKEHLEKWYNRFLTAASESLADLLRFKLELELAGLKIESSMELLRTRGTNFHSVIFRAPPHAGIWMLDIPLNLALFVVERMMGNSAEPDTITLRDLTKLEETVLEQFVATLLKHYAKNWVPYANVSIEILRQERTLNKKRFQESIDVLQRVGIRTVAKGITETINMIIPIEAVEELLQRSTATLVDEAADAAATLKQNKRTALSSVPVKAAIRWQGFKISLRDLDEVQVGDILLLDQKKCQDVSVWLGDRLKFTGRVNRSALKSTITLTAPVE